MVSKGMVKLTDPGNAASSPTGVTAEIELVDEEGQPVAGERYEITAADGETIRKGSLNKQGRAHVSIPKPGNCQICFTKLDADAWERI